MNKHVEPQDLFPAEEKTAPVATPAPDDDPPWTEARHGGPDWLKAGDDIVVHEQPAIAVYWNTKGACLIRQEDVFGDDDSSVVIWPEYVPALIERLKQFLPRK